MAKAEWEMEIENLAKQCETNYKIAPELYEQYEVKRGLRDKNGVGVMAGLTKISQIESSKMVDGKKEPCEGRLLYRGYNINDLVRGYIDDERYGFEETAYLLLFGVLPDKKQLADFKGLLAEERRLPTNFVRDVIMKAPGNDMMNALSKAVLTLASMTTMRRIFPFPSSAPMLDVD